MKDVRLRKAPVSGLSGFLASGLMLVVFAIMPSLAMAAAPPAGNAASEKPRFAKVEVEIWPEFDRRGAVLVIFRGELAADLALPATVSLRIPATSDPPAVAFATAPGSGLFNLEHERIRTDAFTTLRFRTAHRLVHIEFYDRLAPGDPNRRFKYVWPGDVAVDRLAAQLQEPAGARDIVVKPDLGAALKGEDGLLYRRAELGAVDAGKTVPIEVGYTKTDPRTSSEILGLGKPASTPAPAAASSTGLPRSYLIVAVLAALLLGAVSVLLWSRLTGRTSGAPRQGTGFCSKCGNRLLSDDPFCPKCGTPVPGR